MSEAKKKTKEERKLVCPGLGSLSVASVALEWIIIKKGAVRRWRTNCSLVIRVAMATGQLRTRQRVFTDNAAVICIFDDSGHNFSFINIFNLLVNCIISTNIQFNL
jgi:hypothetical protein